MAGEDILALQIRELCQQVLHRIAPGEIFKKSLHRIAKAANARFPMTNVGINRDAREEILVCHVFILCPWSAESKRAGNRWGAGPFKLISRSSAQNAIARMTNEISDVDERLVIRA